MSKSIGSRIAQVRDSKNMNRQQLAKKAKVSVGYLSHIEKDHIPLTDEVAARFEKALGIRLTEKELTKHNAKAKIWLNEYRADLKKAKRKVQKPEAQQTLPGFNLWNEVAERLTQALMRGEVTLSENGTIKKAK